jgi:Tfp pilus assembly protein PilZ
MELYKITYNGEMSPEEFEGVYAISLVEDPANEKMFIALSKQKNVLKLSNKEKQLLTGVVLIPNQKIYRRDENGKEYEIFFPEDVIEKLSQDFLKKGFQSNSTYNHDETKWLKDISVVEQWIIEDPENDKSNALGFTDLPKGTWMVTFKVSDEVWEDYVKTGKVKGFSIDAFLDMEKIKMNNNKTKKRKKMSLLTKLRNLIATTLMKEIQIDGMGSLLSENFEIGDEVFVGDELLKSSSFTYEGFVYVTDEEGIIVSKDEFVEEIQMEGEEDLEGMIDFVSDEVEQITEILEDILDEVQMKKLKSKLAKKAKKTKMEEITEEEAEEVMDIVEDIVEEVSEGDVDVPALEEKIGELEEMIEELKEENEMLKSQLSKKPNTQKLSAVSSINLNETKMEKIARLAKLGQK